MCVRVCVCVCSPMYSHILFLRLLFDNGEERHTLHSLLLFQLEQLLTQHILVPLSQPITQIGMVNTHTYRNARDR